jgi:hypothetical protein
MLFAVMPVAEAHGPLIVGFLGHAGMFFANLKIAGSYVRRLT